MHNYHFQIWFHWKLQKQWLVNYKVNTQNSEVLCSYLSGRLKELLRFGLGKLWMQVDIDHISHLAHVVGISVEDVNDILQFSDLTGPTWVRIKWAKWSSLLNLNIDTRVAPNAYGKIINWFHVRNLDDLTEPSSSPNDFNQTENYDALIESVEQEHGTRYWLHNHRLPVDVAGVIQSCKLYKESLYYKYIICVC